MDSYEKKYKEALEKAKDMLSNKEVRQEDMEYLFPELKESDDERIRKWCISHFKGCINVIKDNDEYKEYLSNKVIAWLEKQGTRPRYNIGDVICDKSCTTLNKESQPNMEIVDIQNGMYICDKGSFPVSQQDEYELVSKKIDTKLNDDSVSNELREASFTHAEREMKNQTFPDNLEFELIYTFEEGAKWNAAQKPAWSKEDEVMLEATISFIKSSPYPYFGDTLRGEISKIETEDWLKSLKDRVKTQQEWTMQDEEELQIALDTLEKAGQHSSAKWLKNVCLVPQNKWKPSDEQLNALEYHLKHTNENSRLYKETKKLYEQLKKL